MTKTKAAFLILFLAAVIADTGHAQASRTTWSEYGGAADNARYITLPQINKSNLSQLDVAWTYPTQDNI